jgi:hypothetical protein
MLDMCDEQCLRSCVLRIDELSAAVMDMFATIVLVRHHHVFADILRMYHHVYMYHCTHLQLAQLLDDTTECASVIATPQQVRYDMISHVFTCFIACVCFRARCKQSLAYSIRSQTA